MCTAALSITRMQDWFLNPDPHFLQWLKHRSFAESQESTFLRKQYGRNVHLIDRNVQGGPSDRQRWMTNLVAMIRCPQSQLQNEKRTKRLGPESNGSEQSPKDRHGCPEFLYWASVSCASANHGRSRTWWRAAVYQRSLWSLTASWEGSQSSV